MLRRSVWSGGAVRARVSGVQLARFPSAASMTVVGMNISGSCQTAGSGGGCAIRLLHRIEPQERSSESTLPVSAGDRLRADKPLRLLPRYSQTKRLIPPDPCSDCPIEHQFERWQESRVRVLGAQFIREYRVARTGEAGELRTRRPNPTPATNRESRFRPAWPYQSKAYPARTTKGTGYSRSSIHAA